MLCFTSLGYAVGQVFFLFAYSDIAMFLARVFAGLFCGGVWTAALNYLVNTAEDSTVKTRNLTVYATVQTVTSACGYFLGGLLGELTTETALVLQVVFLTLSGILFMVVCVDDTPFKHKPENPLRLADVNPFAAFIDVKKYATRLLVLLFIITAITNIGQNTFEQEFNYYIMDHFGLTSVYNGTFKAIIAVVSFIANFTLSMRIARRTNLNYSNAVITALCAIPLGLILLFDNIIPFAAMDILFYGFNALRTPILQNLISSNAEGEYSNNAIGFYQSMTYLGSLFGGLFAGSLYTIKQSLPFTVAFIAFVLGTAVTVIYVRTYKAKNPGAGFLNK